MAQYLRDQQIENLTITAADIMELNTILVNRLNTMPERVNPVEGEQVGGMLFYTIRFDEKGYRVFNTNQLIQYFNNCTNVERIVCQIESMGPLGSLGSSRAVGSYFELRLEADNNANSYVLVSSDDEDWVNLTFNEIAEVLQRKGNNNGRIRKSWLNIPLAFVGLILGFVFSNNIAAIMSDQLSIQYPYLIVYSFTLLCFILAWSVPLNYMLGLVNRYFPKIQFYRSGKDGVGWFKMGIIGTLVGAVVLFVASKVINFLTLLVSNLMP